MASLKPIVHGYSDPTEIPFKCKNCENYDPNGFDFPRCKKRDDGKFNPAIAYSCYKPRITKE